MRSAFGKVNQMHSHILPWTDRPLVTRSLVGGEDGIRDSGISVSKLILNPIMFLEATGEVFGGNSNVFSAPSRGDLTYVGHLRGYRDLTEGTNLDLGTSIAYGHNSTGPDEITRLIGVDATFRYRPLRRAIYKRFTGRTELIWSRQEQPSPDFTAKSFGYYASGEYQFARRWFTNIRWDHASDSAPYDHGPFVMTYWPSEFSQVRGGTGAPVRGGRCRQRVPVPVPVLDRRTRRPHVLIVARQTCRGRTSWPQGSARP